MSLSGPPHCFHIIFPRPDPIPARYVLFRFRKMFEIWKNRFTCQFFAEDTLVQRMPFQVINHPLVQVFDVGYGVNQSLQWQFKRSQIVRRTHGAAVLDAFVSWSSRLAPRFAGRTTGTKYKCVNLHLRVKSTHTQSTVMY